MTEVAVREPATAGSAGQPRADERVAEDAAYPRRTTRRVVIGRTIAITSTVLAVVLLFGVWLYGLTGVSESRKQTTMYRTLQHLLADARAPIGPTGEGKPIAVIDIPAIGVGNLVVVEGTSSRDLARGPGHQRNTAFPGQAGTSVIQGKKSTYGGPFAKIAALNVGDVISVTTGQGIARYRVSAYGTESAPPPRKGANGIVLATADSGYVPHHAVFVRADLTSSVQPPAAPVSVIGRDELANHGDADDAMAPLALWSLALVMVTSGGVLAAFRWSRWPAFLVTAPVLLAVLWNVFENLAVLMPNVY